MTPQNRRKSSASGPQGTTPIQIHRALKGDASSIADLVVRTKRLNNEFDPLFAVVEDAKSRAEKYIVSTIGSPDKLLLVAADGSKIVGVLRAEMRERIFYDPHVEGLVTDFYILPEYRRKALGNQMIKQASAKLKEMGAQIIVADVPSQNEIATRFYVKRGFRSLNQFFGKSP
ncbi:MAG: GNAT family N-acetyltransferase [Thaumarchaeota archaeon]|nr:GNAT family N-acetyltransferase [Nitrososphaerota archaeon]